MYDYSRILIHPDSRLLTPSRPVDDEFIRSGEVLRLIGALKIHLAKSRNGIGIAANQIGGDRRVLIISLRGEEYVMVNPEITKHRGRTMSFERCLSVRNENAIGVGDEREMTGYYVERPKAITVRFAEPTIAGENWLTMEERIIKCAGLLAACVDHEVDHLDGITIVERGKRAAA